MTALDNVSVNIPSGSFHALLGENGAGKSTLVKCIMGFYRADEGTVRLNGKEINISNPKDARANGIGMVYQHFTLVPSLTAAENLVINRADAPAVINWSAEKRRLEEFLDKMPFRVPLNTPISSLAAGEKQKLEILKLLYLDQRFMILDEPTSVLTPSEADEILGLLKQMALAKDITVVIITHKFREVTAFADAVTVLRRGKQIGGGKVGELTTQDMARMMIGDTPIRETATAQGEPARQGRARPVGPLRRGRGGAAGASTRSTSPCMRARSSASPASPATASRSWWRCCRASGRWTTAASSSAASASSRRARTTPSSRCSGCPRSRSRMPPCRA